MKWIVIVTPYSEDDRAYMMPWYSEFHVFDTKEEADDYACKFENYECYVTEGVYHE